MTTYTDMGTGETLPASDPRTMETREERIAAAAAEQAAFEGPLPIWASSVCPVCHQPQSSMNCEKREHWTFRR